MKVVVAGTGAVGLAVALKLAKAGGGVTICDPSPGGGQASRIAAGMLAPGLETALDDDGRDYDLLSAAAELWPDLAAQIGLALDVRPAIAVGSLDTVDLWADRLTRAGARFERLSAQQAVGLAPGLAPPDAALQVNGDMRLDCAVAMARLKQSAKAAGAVFLNNTVASWDGEAARLDDGSSLSADALVAAGGYVPDGVGLAAFGLVPIKGQIAKSADVRLAGPVVRGQGIYVCPSDDGVIIGATMETGCDDLSIVPKTIEALKRKASGLFPALADAVFAGAAGVRAATIDGLPLVGPWADGLIAATGMRRNGWLLAPLTAEIVAAYLMQDDVGPYAARLEAKRFKSSEL